MVTIFLNEEERTVGSNTNISELLHQINAPTVGIAIAVNSTIIPQSIWTQTHLKQNDKVLIVQATQGG